MDLIRPRIPPPLEMPLLEPDKVKIPTESRIRTDLLIAGVPGSSHCFSFSHKTRSFHLLFRFIFIVAVMYILMPSCNIIFLHSSSPRPLFLKAICSRFSFLKSLFHYSHFLPCPHFFFSFVFLFLFFLLFYLLGRSSILWREGGEGCKTVVSQNGPSSPANEWDFRT